MTAYAELAVTTNFSFLRGASHPQEMVAAARALGIAAIGIADRNSLAGVVRAYQEARKGGIGLLVGARLVTREGDEIIAYPRDRAAYGRLCRLLSEGNLRSDKAECDLGFADVLAIGEGTSLIAVPPEAPSPTFAARVAALAAAAPGRAFLAASHRHRGDETRRLGLLAELAAASGTPMVATGEALYHEPGRRRLADVLTCIREKCTVFEAGLRLEANEERHLKPPAAMARLFAAFPDALARTMEIAQANAFSLGDLKYEYPDEPVPPGKTPQQHLEDLTWEGAARRYPPHLHLDGVPGQVRRQIEGELALIEKLDYARYFLTVHDVVAYARSEGILCQGRGSAANSAVCFCLGITEVNPDKGTLLFSRFISERRGEPPDIDVDFEHERREEVIQYVYGRYGRRRAAICATVIHYRSRRAVGEVGKALGLTPDVTSALSRTVWGSHEQDWTEARIRQAGLDPANPAIKQALGLAAQITGFPRHLSQHVGGFVLTRGRLDETVPIGNAAMEKRTFIEWDKDDIDTLGLMKVDVLALGMLSCIRRGLDFLRSHYGKTFQVVADLPSEDPAVYEMASRADTVGVFQIESRAQMSMLPRLKPKTFYDLVIEVAIVRPGPIQGDMVHPYLRRRDGLEQPSYPSPSPEHGKANELEEVLKRTLGVPLFQEQAMQIAITAAGFSGDDADGLRKSMATFRQNGTINTYKAPFIEGMVRRGYQRDFAERCFSQIEGFGDYGFPESHAASFALLVYASAWIKCHHPDVFCAAILNSQPMGFYQPAQLVRDARKHGVEVREIDVNASDWDCTLEPAAPDSPHRFAVRLGLRLVQGLGKDQAELLVARRGNGFSSVESLGAIAGLGGAVAERLADADAFRSLGLDRRAALWAAKRLPAIGLAYGKSGALPLLAGEEDEALFPEPAVTLPAMRASEHVLEDYRAFGLSLKDHPCRFFRSRLARLGAMPNAGHRDPALAPDARVAVAGLVLTRQMPGTSKGVVFATLEDETDIANIIVWPKVFEANRRVVMSSRFLLVRGRLQRAGLVIHVLAESFVDLTRELARMADEAPGTMQLDLPLQKSRDFH